MPTADFQLNIHSASFSFLKSLLVISQKRSSRSFWLLDIFCSVATQARRRSGEHPFSKLFELVQPIEGWACSVLMMPAATRPHQKRRSKVPRVQESRRQGSRVKEPRSQWFSRGSRRRQTLPRRLSEGTPALWGSAAAAAGVRCGFRRAHRPVCPDRRNA